MEERPAVVSDMTKQAGDSRSKWAWVEPCVWTERMLAALDKGVKGGKWFSLLDKVYSEKNLMSAYTRVNANKGSAGVDHQSVDEFGKHLDANLSELHLKLKEDRYYPQSIRRVWIPKPGSKEKRPLGIPTVKDRVVQTALRNVLEPIFERDFSDRSFGFRPGRGCKDALSCVWHLLQKGYTYVVDADLKSYFDTIPHANLLELIKQKIADGNVLRLLESYLTQGVLDEMSKWSPDEGTPQGAVISPLLANIYLDPLDHLMEESGVEMARYADDLVLLCSSQEEAEAALQMLRDWTANAGLTLHPTKTRIVNALEGPFEFLGYRFERGKYLNVRSKSLTKLKDTIRRKTKRTNGKSLKATIQDVNKSLLGWFEYFKHCHGNVFRRLDGWTRMRLRSILRKQNKRHGIGHGWDHIRWPNAYFEERGLFSLQAACEKYRQSCTR
jgi:RNA-directed DNA polymerase